MRVRVTFKVKNRGASIPFHHQHLISSFIKEKLKDGGENGLSDFSLYSFSGVKGLTRVSRQGLHYHSKRVSVVISSVNDLFVKAVIKGIFNSKSIKFGELEVIPELVDEEMIPEFGSETKMICISPIIPHGSSYFGEDSKRYIDPFSNEFSDLLFDIVATKFEANGGNPENVPDFNKFQIVPDKDYIDKINNNGKKFSRIYRVVDNSAENEARGYTFPFKLYAPPEIQQFIFQCGIDQFGSRGFGMVDLANQDPLERTKKMDIKTSIVA
ncbi:MAG: CRISPR-associated protein Cas6 [bacterium]|nr:CRISPR-associated protein Cas6 [bacterium]